MRNLGTRHAIADDPLHWNWSFQLKIRLTLTMYILTHRNKTCQIKKANNQIMVDNINKWTFTSSSLSAVSKVPLLAGGFRGVAVHRRCISNSKIYHK